MMKVLSRAEVWQLTLQHGAGETATNTVFMPVSSLSVWRGDRGHFVPLCAGPHLTFIHLGAHWPARAWACCTSCRQ